MCRVHLDVRAISPFYYLVKSSTKCLTVRAAALTLHRFPAEPMLFLFYEAHTCLHFGAPGFGGLHTPPRGPRSASLRPYAGFLHGGCLWPPAIRCRSWASLRGRNAVTRRRFCNAAVCRPPPSGQDPGRVHSSWPCPAGPRSLPARHLVAPGRLEWVVTAQGASAPFPRITVSAPEDGAWIYPHKVSLSLKGSFNLQNINSNGLVKCSNDQNQAFDELSFNLCIYSHANTLH